MLKTLFQIVFWTRIFIFGHIDCLIVQIICNIISNHNDWEEWRILIDVNWIKKIFHLDYCGFTCTSMDSVMCVCNRGGGDTGICLILFRYPPPPQKCIFFFHPNSWHKQPCLNKHGWFYKPTNWINFLTRFGIENEAGKKNWNPLWQKKRFQNLCRKEESAVFEEIKYQILSFVFSF